MDRDEVGKILRQAAARARGYADFFDGPDKSLKEWGIAQTFLEELQRNGGPKIRCGKQHPGGANHAPDFQIISADGGIWGVEITELVSQKAIEATKRGEEVFADWSDAQLIAQFDAIIAKKDDSSNVKGGPIYIGIDGHRRDAHLLAGPHDSQRDLAAVRNQDFIKHFRH